MVIIKFSLHISDYEMKIYEMMKHIDDPLMTYIESDLSPKENIDRNIKIHVDII